MIALNKKLVVFGLVFILISFLVLTGEVTAEERYGGSLNAPLPYGGTVGTLEPAQTSRIQDFITIGQIFDRLVRVNPDTLEPEPAIAESWDVSEDGKTFTFYLREDVKFHNGEQLTAHDVKFTFERIMDPVEASAQSDLLENIAGVAEFREGEADEITGIRVVDDFTIELTLQTVDIGLLLNLAHRGASILPQQAVEEQGAEFFINPIGSGPFKFVEWIRGSEINLEAFEDYYEGRPYVDELSFKVMPEAASRTASFRAEELDMDIVYPAQFQEFREDPHYQDYLIDVPELWTRNIHFNLDIVQDKRIRQAFNYAIDEELLVERLLYGMAYPAVGWLPTTSPGFNPDLEGYSYNPDRARELMEEAGYTPDDPYELTVIGTDHPAWGVEVVEAIMPMLADVGISVTPELVDGATWMNRVTTGDFEAGIHSWGGEVSPAMYMSNYFWSRVSREAGNYVGYSNPEFDEYIEKALETVDFEERMGYVREAEKILVDDAPVWFFNYNRAVAIHHPWVHGLVENPKEMVYQPFKDVWVDETSPRK